MHRERYKSEEATLRLETLGMLISTALHLNGASLKAYPVLGYLRHKIRGQTLKKDRILYYTSTS